MTVRDLIHALFGEPMDATVYIGKGMGPLATVEYVVKDKIYVILSPAKPGRES